MKKTVLKTLKCGALLLLGALSAFVAFRAYVAWRSPPLALWHTFVPAEMTARDMDAADWEGYLRHEAGIFAAVRAQVTEKLPPEDRVEGNRFYEGARIYPDRFRENWNRSYLMLPDGPPAGAVVLLHGLTDAPYSLRHVARMYRDRGYLALGIRLPGHGTVPAGLTRVAWEDWMAATRLAVREAEKRVGCDLPLHIVGFSNGGALAMKYALDALEDPSLPRADRLILFSPMVGITRFARFAGIAALPALFPAFAKSAWLDVLPEFNPFKYNSFPVNGARQSYRLTAALQKQIQHLAGGEVFSQLPPVLTFQSVMDSTVSTPAIFYALYAYLPENGSEMVLFDINRATIFGPLMRRASTVVLSRVVPPFPLQYDLSIVGNAWNDGSYLVGAISRTVRAGKSDEAVRDLGLEYPSQIFSLSHVGVPFPMDDSLYGMDPVSGGEAEFGVRLGRLSARGERGTLAVNIDTLARTSSNPFYPYVAERIAAALDDPAPKRISPAYNPPGVPADVYFEEIKKFIQEPVEEKNYETP